MEFPDHSLNEMQAYLGTILGTYGPEYVIHCPALGIESLNISKKFFKFNGIEYNQMYLTAGTRIKIYVIKQHRAIHFIEIEGIDIYEGNITKITDDNVIIDCLFHNQNVHITTQISEINSNWVEGDKVKLHYANNEFINCELIPKHRVDVSSTTAQEYVHENYKPPTSISQPIQSDFNLSDPLIPGGPIPSPVPSVPSLLTNLTASDNIQTSRNEVNPQQKIIQEMSSIIATVGEYRLPLSSLKSLFGSNNVILDKISQLESAYESWRKVFKGDGNSFYRAVGIAYIEHLARVTTPPHEFERFIYRLKFDPSYSTPNLNAENKNRFLDYLEWIMVQKSLGKPILEQLYACFKETSFNSDLICIMKSLTSNIFETSSKCFEGWNDEQKQTYNAGIDKQPQGLALKALSHVLGVTLKISNFLNESDEIMIEADDMFNQPIIHLLNSDKEYDLLYTKEHNIADRYDSASLLFTKQKYKKTELFDCKKSFYNQSVTSVENPEQLLAKYAIDLQNHISQQHNLMKELAKHIKEPKLKALALKSFAENVMPLNVRSESSSNQAVNDVKKNEEKLLRKLTNQKIQLGCGHEGCVDELKEHLHRIQQASRDRNLEVNCPMCIYRLSEAEINKINSSV